MPAGGGADAVTINPITNKVYVADKISNNVSAFDAAVYDLIPISMGGSPRSLAVDTELNKIFAGNWDAWRVAQVSSSNVELRRGVPHVSRLLRDMGLGCGK
jgi:DNA-binding beta-propeller fold protein YncE